MYHQSTTGFSNNPFLEDPSGAGSATAVAASRFPDVGAIDRAGAQYGGGGYGAGGSSTGGYGAGGGGGGYVSPGLGQQQWPGAQQQQQQPSFTGSPYGGGPAYGGAQPQPQPQQQQQPYGYLQPQQSQYGQPQSPYGYSQQQQQQQQPQYPQQQQAQSPGPYGFLNPQQTGFPGGGGGGSTYLQAQPTGYGGYGQQQPQQLQQFPVDGSYQGYNALQPTYGAAAGHGAGAGVQPPQSVAEFDPLNPTANTALHPHPRDYVRTHKRELEAWDAASWKQALNALDALRAAWTARAEQSRARVAQGGYYLGAMEGQRLVSVQRDAEHNVDTITASSLQMQEVLAGYRQSADVASKNRVREALNAALQQLPEWPPQNW